MNKFFISIKLIEAHRPQKVADFNGMKIYVGDTVSNQNTDVFFSLTRQAGVNFNKNIIMTPTKAAALLYSADITKSLKKHSNKDKNDLIRSNYGDITSQKLITQLSEVGGNSIPNIPDRYKKLFKFSGGEMLGRQIKMMQSLPQYENKTVNNNQQAIKNVVFDTAYVMAVIMQQPSVMRKLLSMIREEIKSNFERERGNKGVWKSIAKDRTEDGRFSKFYKSRRNKSRKYKGGLARPPAMQDTGLLKKSVTSKTEYSLVEWLLNGVIHFGLQGGNDNEASSIKYAWMHNPLSKMNQRNPRGINNVMSPSQRGKSPSLAVRQFLYVEKSFKHKTSQYIKSLFRNKKELFAKQIEKVLNTSTSNIRLDKAELNKMKLNKMSGISDLPYKLKHIFEWFEIEEKKLLGQMKEMADANKYNSLLMKKVREKDQLSYKVNTFFMKQKEVVNEISSLIEIEGTETALYKGIRLLLGILYGKFVLYTNKGIDEDIINVISGGDANNIKILKKTLGSDVDKVERFRNKQNGYIIDEIKRLEKIRKEKVRERGKLKRYINKGIEQSKKIKNYQKEGIQQTEKILERVGKLLKSKKEELERQIQRTNVERADVDKIINDIIESVFGELINKETRDVQGTLFNVIKKYFENVNKIIDEEMEYIKDTVEFENKRNNDILTAREYAEQKRKDAIVMNKKINILATKLFGINGVIATKYPGGELYNKSIGVETTEKILKDNQKLKESILEQIKQKQKNVKKLLVEYERVKNRIKHKTTHVAKLREIENLKNHIKSLNKKLEFINSQIIKAEEAIRDNNYYLLKESRTLKNLRRDIQVKRKENEKSLKSIKIPENLELKGKK